MFYSRYNGVDLVIDCSGSFKSKGELLGFIEAGAKRVMGCYYLGNDLPTIAYGVNHETLTGAFEDYIISFAPMETQVLANVLKPLYDLFGVESAIAKSYRSYTNSQPTVDSYDSKSFARGRAAAWNISPLGDNLSKCTGLTFPELNGKVIGMSYRAPILNGSVLDITVVSEKEATVSQLNACFKSNSRYYGYNEELLCSSDAMNTKDRNILPKQP